MNGKCKGAVKFKVVIALLQAYREVLYYDGLKSILKEAGMLHLNDLKDINSNLTLDIFSFKKILSAQNCLLYGSYKLLYKIGKRFSFYLFPFGNDFEEIIKKINELIIADWKVEIFEKKENLITIRVQKCIFSPEIGVPGVFFKGFLIQSLDKTLSPAHKAIFFGQKDDLHVSNHKDFLVKLKIENKD